MLKMIETAIYTNNTKSV